MCKSKASFYEDSYKMLKKAHAHLHSAFEVASTPTDHLAHAKHSNMYWCNPKWMGKRKMEGEKLQLCKVSCAWAHAWAGTEVLLLSDITPKAQSLWETDIWKSKMNEHLLWLTNTFLCTVTSVDPTPNGGMQQGQMQNSHLHILLEVSLHSHFDKSRKGCF